MAAVRILVRSVVAFMRKAWPWILKAAWHAFELTLGSFISYVKGANVVNRQIAQEFRRKAVADNFPQNWQQALERITYIVAIGLNIVGLILLSHAVVIVFWLIF